MDAVYELKLETYKGPLEKLLELIEEKKMEITSVNIAEVTGDFLQYIEKLGEEEKTREYIADFLVVASKLILIKSKVLLPSLPLTEEEESDISNFEARLRLYQELKHAQPHIKEGWREFPQMMHREFLMTMGPLFYPPKRITVDDLHNSIQKAFGELQKVLRPVGVIKAEIINLREKINEVFSRLTDSPTLFKHLREGKTKGEVVVLFLAILHLIKDQLINVEQENHFAEMTVAKTQKSQ
ncbi:MAG: segregation/condensation protein A [Patescibacteria group bacterium]